MNDRRRAALRMLARVERREGLHRGRRRQGFDVATNWALRDGSALGHVPAHLRPDTSAAAAEAPLYRVRAASRSDLIRFGKFDRARTTRARAFLEAGRPLTIKLQTEHVGEVEGHGVVAEARARREVSRLVPGLTPDLLSAGHDTRTGYAWLVEETVDGEHPSRPTEVDAVVDQIVQAVARLYRAAGYTSRPASAVVSPAFRCRLAEAAALDGRIAPYLAVAERLLDADRDVEMALGHGDLVGSNVLIRPDGELQLVDWEHSGVLPVAADVGKVLLQAGDKARALASIERHLGSHVGIATSSHPLRDQLVLTQLQVFSRYVHRHGRATAAGRLSPFEVDTVRRLRTLDALLG